MTNAFDGLFKEAVPIVPLKVEGAEGCGYGRLIQLTEKISLSDAILRIKKHFNLPHGKTCCSIHYLLFLVRVGQRRGHSSLDERDIVSIAVCAGSGTNIPN